MARILRSLSYVCILISFLIICSDARKTKDLILKPVTNCSSLICQVEFNSSKLIENATPTGSNFTHICDPIRLAHLGLNKASFAFCDEKLPYNVRAKDLVNQMTLVEKVLQLGNNATGVPRLGLPRYDWWSEALHGMSNVGPGTFFDNLVPGATSFPTPILTTASFNKTLWKTIGQAVSTEARAAFNLGRGGLTFWSPTINVVRDPRWGRTLETPGEDPFVVGTYASNYVRGLQDVPGTENFKDLNSRPLKISACCKHYTAYDVDNWQGIQRYSFDARVTQQDLVETFSKPFEMCVKDGDASSIMCSYNRVNGIPTCADPRLLNETIRGDWNLHGYIVADCDSIEVMVDDHKWLNVTNEEAVGQTLRAGLDLDCGSYYPLYVANATEKGDVHEADIDKALIHLYVVLMRLGYFDGHTKFSNLGNKDICSNENKELAIDAARQGIVLLKNDGTLPLRNTNIKSVALIGPHANASEAMIGNYAFDSWKPGRPCQYTTPLAGFSIYALVNYAIGCVNVKCGDQNSISSAVQAAKTSDATIILVGLDLSVEAEGLDRKDLLLPGFQTNLINEVANAAKGPVILVIMSAGGVDITFAINNPKVNAILWAGYPGEAGGQAIADVVFGQYNPGGRLPITWYQASYINNFPMTSMQMRPDTRLGYPGRTYKFFNGPTVFPFGYGLSYTNFTYNLVSSTNEIAIRLNRFQHCQDLNYQTGSFKPACPAILVDDLKCDQQIQFVVEVQNVGNKDGNQVILVYSKAPVGIVGAPLNQVIGFERVFIPVGGSIKVPFVINACKSLSIVNDGGSLLLPSGGHKIMIGDGGLSFPLQVDYKN